MKIDAYYDVTVILPFIRPDRAQLCINALEDQPCYIIAQQDKERIGCPKMVNKLAARAETPYICFLGDDTIPQPCMIEEVLKSASKSFPDGVGLVCLNDGVHAGRLATHFLIHRDMIAMLGGELFCEEYKHNFCDLELTERCRAMGRYLYAPLAKLTHNHPMINTAPADKFYEYAQSQYQTDLTTYIRRHKARVGWGSIAIAARLTSPDPLFVSCYRQLATAM